ncbi:ankyrin repeat-containing domain protein [Chytriomyces sp. MP71]|nr:ankyrin repeat-containing domain protein [Chytriomyces sp. MP71]
MSVKGPSSKGSVKHRGSVAARPSISRYHGSDLQNATKSPVLQILKATARTMTLAWMFHPENTPPHGTPVQIVRGEANDPDFVRVYEGADDYVVVDGLKPETVYRFKMRIWDPESNEFSSKYVETAGQTTDESKILKIQLRLYRAVTENDVGAFRELMDEYRPEINVEMRDKNGKTLLMLAALKGTGAMVEAILSYGANQTTSTQSKKTPLSLAVSYSNLPVVEALLKDKDIQLAINLPDQGGSTPLMWAVEHANFKNGLEVVNALIDAGADVTREDSNGLTALERICNSGGNAKAARMLLENGAQIVNKHDGKKKVTTLMMAALNGYKDLCLELIDKWNADVFAKTEYGQTAKMMAEGSGHAELALLLEKRMIKEDY